MCRFGPAGNSPAFYKSGGKSSLEVPQWLYNLGLSAYEYQCGRGVKTGEETAKLIGINAEKYGIALSIHAPYYINLCTPEKDKLQKSKNHLLKSMQLAKWMKADLVVFHPGSVGSLDRKDAFKNAARALEDLLINEVPKWGLDGIKISPETMGRKSQFGSLDEVIELCKIFNLVPTIDFAHIHALGQGLLKTKDDFNRIFEKVESNLGYDVLKNLHIHFSQIEFTASGEKRHWSMREEGFGPDFSLLAPLLIEKDLEATIICESADRQVEDALVYKSIYDHLKN
ncbi:MAG: Xylose isomerase domain-containing protein TIM barrel [Clostridia bacterium 41_269]|nr:MAG: Xylose isomerase domain-containing protein TIM barrel [Clostridia bacterium 41_269]